MPISLTILTGANAGKTAAISDTVDPLETLRGFARADIKWEIDFSEATVDETLEWSGADLVARILAALYHGRTVTFEHSLETREWRLRNPPALTIFGSKKEALRVAGEIKDAISSSGMKVYVSMDDDNGVTVSCIGPAQ